LTIHLIFQQRCYW